MPQHHLGALLQTINCRPAVSGPPHSRIRTVYPPRTSTPTRFATTRSSAPLCPHCSVLCGTSTRPAPESTQPSPCANSRTLTTRRRGIPERPRRTAIIRFACSPTSTSPPPLPMGSASATRGTRTRAAVFSACWASPAPAWPLRPALRQQRGAADVAAKSRMTWSPASSRSKRCARLDFLVRR